MIQEKITNEKIELADNLLLNYKDLTGFDFRCQKRNPDKAYKRALFYKILKDLAFFNDREISEWFKRRGEARNRSAIFTAISKIEAYYINFEGFRNIYDLYFADKKEHFDRISKRKLSGLHQRKSEKEQTNQEKQKDSLQGLIDALPANKRLEVYEMVNLRVKSWEWKNKDKCEIIEGFDGLSERVY